MVNNLGIHTLTQPSLPFYRPRKGFKHYTDTHNLTKEYYRRKTYKNQNKRWFWSFKILSIYNLSKVYIKI